MFFSLPVWVVMVDELEQVGGGGWLLPADHGTGVARKANGRDKPGHV